MALLIRLRRAAALSSSILKDCSISSHTSHYSHFPLSNRRCPLAFYIRNPSVRRPSEIRSSSFHSSIACSVRRFDSDQGSKIPEDEILFEGCDYNHWLITMDFPKDPKPSPEEMVETYVQTLAKVVGSVEEAKKRMYACSTTTYQGFQAVMSEEMSEKFRGLPGVVFILPDSYIDPVNKEYGGDKYDNGVITPRPPPIHYGRQGRYGDRNRRYDQPRYERQRPPSPMQGRDPPHQYEPQQMHQGNPPADYQGSSQGYGRNYNPQQTYGPPGQDGRNYSPPGGIQQGYSPMQQGNPQPTYGPPGQDGRTYSPPGGIQQGYSPMQQGNPQQTYGPPGQDGRNYSPAGVSQQGYPPMQQGNPPRQEGHPQFQQGYGRSYGPPQNYGLPRQDGQSYGRPSDTPQGYSPVQQGNPQMQQRSPQMQPGNQQYSRNDPMQDGGPYTLERNYGPQGDKERD